MKILLSCLLGVVVEAPPREPRQLFPRQRFEVGERPAFVILPAKDKPKRDGSIPWVLYAPTFDGNLPSDRDEGWMMRRLLDRGIAIAGVDVGES